jgi:hypothetical protein
MERSRPLECRRDYVPERIDEAAIDKKCSGVKTIASGTKPLPW